MSPPAPATGLSLGETLAAGWLLFASLWALVLFGYDKWCAGRPRAGRISESTLLLAALLGGWPGGLIGMFLFRHKSARPAFQLKFLGAVLLGTVLATGLLHLRGRL